MKKGLKVLIIMIVLLLPLESFASGNEVVKDEVVYGLKDIKFSPSIRTKKDLKKYVTEKVETRTDKITVKYYGDDIKNTRHAVEIMRTIRDNRGYHQANGWIFRISVTQKDEYVEIDYLTKYRTSDDEEEFIDKEVDRIVKEYIKPGMGEIEKIRTLHDYLVNNTKYSLETKGSPYTAYTIFKEGKGVCNGYVLAFMKLMDAINVETLYVMGTVENEDSLHAWNKIKVNNVWYNVDITWSSPAEKYGLHNAYKYFLNSDNRFYKSHTPTSMQGLPKSLDTKYDGQYDGNFSKIVK